MQRWGLGYEQLRKIRPDIIYVSMAGFGHTGRYHWSLVRHYGPGSAGVKRADAPLRPARQAAGRLGLVVSGRHRRMYGAISALTALRHRSATGKGQHVDLSQMITGITLTGPAMLDKTVNGRQARREGFPPGNRTVWPGAEVVNNYRGPSPRLTTPTAPLRRLTTGRSSPV